MKIIIIGPPGSGKGTYASRLASAYQIPHVSTGDIVREEIKAHTEIGEEMKRYSDKGELVPDKIIISLLSSRLSRPDSRRGFILDGFPRTREQAKAMDIISTIDLVINLNVPDEVIVARLSNRLVCRNCDAIYNKLTLRPKADNVCDNCRSDLYQRADDKPEVIQERLQVYREKTSPLIEYYAERGIMKDVYCNDLMTPPEAIVEKIKLIIDETRLD